MVVRNPIKKKSREPTDFKEKEILKDLYSSRIKERIIFYKDNKNVNLFSNYPFQEVWK